MKLISYKVWGNPKARVWDYIISIFTLGEYSHSELVFSDGMSFSISNRLKTPKFKNIDINSGSWDIIDFEVAPNIEQKIKRLCLYKQKQKFTYDYKGAFFSPLRICKHYKNKYFCSELVVDVLRDYIFDLQPGCKYTPSRLQKTIQTIKEIKCG